MSSPKAIGDLLGGIVPASVQRAAAATTPKAQPKGGKLSRADSALIASAAEIATTPPEGQDMAFTHAVLCQVGLPRAKVEGREFMRQSGAAWVNVQSGWLDEGKWPVLQPVPYGAMPRLALAWISTDAIGTGEK